MKLPGAGPICCLILAAVIAAILPFSQRIDIEAIKQWQVLIGFVGSIGAGFVAWYNVSRQLRTNLMIREEDRLVRELPQLRAAEYFTRVLAQRIRETKGADAILQLWTQYGLTLAPNQPIVKLLAEKNLKDVSDDILVPVSYAVWPSINAAHTIAIVKQRQIRLAMDLKMAASKKAARAAQLDEAMAKALNEFLAAADPLILEQEELSKRMTATSDRLAIVRKRLNAMLGAE